MFVTGLLLSAGAVPDHWIVMQDLIWQDAKFGTLTCPRGFLTDLASIPMAFRNIPFLDPNGLSRRPAAISRGGSRSPTPTQGPSRVDWTRPDLASGRAFIAAMYLHRSRRGEAFAANFRPCFGAAGRAK